MEPVLNRGVVLEQLGRLPEAVTDYEARLCPPQSVPVRCRVRGARASVCLCPPQSALDEHYAPQSISARCAERLSPPRPAERSAHQCSAARQSLSGRRLHMLRTALCAWTEGPTCSTPLAEALKR